MCQKWEWVRTRLGAGAIKFHLQGKSAAVSFREHQGSWSQGFVDHKYQADEDGSTSRKEAIMLESVEETEESVCMWIHAWLGARYWEWQCRGVWIGSVSKVQRMEASRTVFLSAFGLILFSAELPDAFWGALRGCTFDVCGQISLVWWKSAKPRFLFVEFLYFLMHGSHELNVSSLQ